MLMVVELRLVKPNKPPMVAMCSRRVHLVGLLMQICTGFVPDERLLETHSSVVASRRIGALKLGSQPQLSEALSHVTMALANEKIKSRQAIMCGF
jgi:hypothetical protein